MVKGSHARLLSRFNSRVRQSDIEVFQENLNTRHGVWICARLMVIDSPPITWDLKHNLNVKAKCGSTIKYTSAQPLEPL